MPTTFKNTVNGHIETVSDGSWPCALFFGVFYLIYKGLWAHVCIWLLVVIGFTALTGGPGLIIAMPLISIVYAVAIRGILEGSYLKRGWVKVEGTDHWIDASSSERACPFCAETIKKAAVKCKHCGADVPKDESSPRPVMGHGWTVRIECGSEESLEKAYDSLADLGVPVIERDGLTARSGYFPDKDAAQDVRRDIASRYRLESEVYYQSPA